MPTPITGQATATGGAAVALSSSPVLCTVFTIRASSLNAAAVAVGPSGVTTGTGYLLDPGTEFTYERNTQQTDSRRELSVSDFFVNGTTGDKVSWLASPQ